MYTGKRGKTLENIIEYTNKVYRHKGVALVDKVPTPWKVYYNRRNGRVSKAFPEKKGTVDFIGISHGRGIAFDAKSTKNRTSFKLDYMQEHQLDYLTRFKDQGGVAFFIVYFEKHQEAYYLPIEAALEWWENSKAGGRKSIPYNWFLLHCDLIQTKNGVPLDYLKSINRRGEGKHESRRTDKQVDR